MNVFDMLPEQQKPDRLHWKTWVPSNREDRWNVFQHLLLALTTNIENDAIVKIVAPAIFKATSSRLSTKESFDNPISVCKDPATVFHKPCDHERERGRN